MNVSGLLYSSILDPWLIYMNNAERFKDPQAKLHKRPASFVVEDLASK